MKKKFLLVWMALLPILVSCDVSPPFAPDSEQDEQTALVFDRGEGALLDRDHQGTGEDQSDSGFLPKPGTRSGFNTRNGVSINDSLYTELNP